MAPMLALCVMTAVVVPSSRLARSITSSTTTPVLTSSAPVGSSHSSTCGRLAIARAIATRCCSPPDICEGKWSIRPVSPTSPSASSGRSGSRAMSVTRATFSRAVRLGTRL